MKEFKKIIDLKQIIKTDKPISVEMPFIGPDRKYYYSLEALQFAEEEWKRQNLRFKSSITGKEYPVTPEGHSRMKVEERAEFLLK